MKFFFLGLPGSGKTTLGKELSASLGISFVDLDIEIERKAGKKITKIFHEQGEIYFRELESEVLTTLCSSPSGFVMATGGGAPCFKDNMMMMNKTGKSIFLDVPPEVIVKRIQLEGLAERPLLASLPPEALMEKIQLLRAQRIKFYEQSLFCLRGGDIKAVDIIKLIGS